MANTKSTFDGFPKELLRFLESLEKNNTKKWFEAHRKNYEAYYLEPAKQFVEALALPLSKISDDIVVLPKINGSIKRINNDIRFSKNKALYKNHMHLSFWYGKKKLKVPPAFHFRISPKEFGLGAGTYMFDPPSLKKFQQAVANEKKGKLLESAVKKVQKKVMELGGEKYKKVPRGFDTEHPRAELLKHKGFFIHQTEKPPKELFGKNAVGYTMKKIQDTKPIFDWLVENTT